MEAEDLFAWKGQKFEDYEVLIDFALKLEGDEQTKFVREFCNSTRYARQNVGYIAGYYGREKAELIWKIFETAQMSYDRKCPSCGAFLKLIGSHGIVDYDGNWDAQASKYECYEGKHIVFVVDHEAVIDPEDLAFPAVEDVILDSLRTAAWNSGKHGEVSLMSRNINPTLGPPIKSIDDLRDALAKRAVDAFKDEIEENPENHNFENVEYEYIHAMEDVDDILSDEEFKTKLEALGWLKKT